MPCAPTRYLLAGAFKCLDWLIDWLIDWLLKGFKIPNWNWPRYEVSPHHLCEIIIFKICKYRQQIEKYFIEYHLLCHLKRAVGMLALRHRSKQLYGITYNSWNGTTVVRTTVVMVFTENFGRLPKSVTPYQRHPSERIETKFGIINYVIDLNNLAKFDFGIFSGTDTRVCAFLLFLFFWNFLISLTRIQPKQLNRLSCAISKMTPLVIGGTFSMTLTFKRSNYAILCGLKNVDLHFLENGTKVYMESLTGFGML